MAKLGTPWSIFKHQVEGRPGPMSCVFRDGELQYCSDDIPKGAKPDLKLLADVLRSKIQLPDYIRQWLADLFDPEAGSRFQFRKLEKRKGGAGPAPTIDFEVVNFIHEEISRRLSGRKPGSERRNVAARKNAIADAVIRFGISIATIEKCLAVYEAALQETFRINEENAEFEKQQARKVKKNSK